VPLLDPATVVLATIAVSLLLFVTEKVRFDLIAVGVATVLAATGVLTPSEAFGGFSSPAVVLVASMYVFGAAFTRWGIAEALGARVLGRAEGLGEAGLVIRIVLLSALLSSVLSNAGVVAILIPVLSGVARRQRLPVSKLLMPLAFGSLLGGLLSVIATSKNLAVNGILTDLGYTPFGLFEFTPFGLALLGVGALYFLFPGRQLLPASRVDESLSEHYQVRRFVTEVLVQPSSTLINRSVADIESFQEYGVSVLGIARPDSTTVLAPGAYNRVRSEDVLLLQGAPEDIVRLRDDKNLSLVSAAPLRDSQLVAGDVQLVEAVVPAGSDLAGRTLADTDFLERTGLNVLALSKHGELQPGRITDAALEVGDTLLIQGHDRDVERLRRSRELLVLGELESRPLGRGGLVSLLTLAAVLAVAFLGWMPLSVTALSGAMVLLLTNTVMTRDVYAHLDLQALLLIGGMLALGQAFGVSGLDHELTTQLRELGGLFGSPRMLVAALMLATALLTQVTTHIAAATIMTPIALSFAQELAVDERAFVMAVVTGASLAFMSPVAHQANAMVVGPGDYRYRDFLRVGTPLTLLLFAAATALIPIFFGLSPLR
jgi:di/tricarboxylate transporter